MAQAGWRLCLAIPMLIVACRPAREPAAGEAALTAARGTAGGSTAAHAERMPHCPSVVPGATTVVGEVPDGVALRITASGDAANEIRKRANYLSTQADEKRGRHRANGEVGAVFGRCPVVMRNTKVEVSEIPGGALVTVRPSNPAELDWLRRESEARSAQLAAPKPFGQGLMASCPNAVPNAETRVVDSPHGVVMTVTGTTDEETRLIKQRAKELAARSAPVEARCAASVPNSVLFVEETPTGVTMTIKAKNPKDVPLLRHAVREHVETYAPPVLR